MLTEFIVTSVIIIIIIIITITIIIIIIIIIIFFQFLGGCEEYYDQGPSSINISSLACSSETQCRRHNEVGLINEERNQCILPQLADLLLPFL